ncbi:LuxR family transcriptional regulator [Kutzneria sp. 744]|uniref:helix-turn-helix transcriptional regulator n=1 Tax=Kutzneria sp. (strain 744) TaxID=345341 RepID=UPI0003EED783|nr:LuxR family transcriptional regulator [Kutzneria sp. 744]EWM18430.1 transcriptional regulator [Kutzneria sp. 744]
MLEALGLTTAEERVYRAVVLGHRARPSEIATQLDITPSALSPLLDDLLDKGLISRVGGHYVPAPPDVALGPLLVHGQAELERARAAVGQLAEQYRKDVRRRDSTQLVEVLTGAEAIRQQAMQLQREARTEMLWFCRTNPIAMTSAENEEEFRALARGVRYQVVYESALLGEPGALKGLADGIRAGEQARTVDTVPVRLAIADRKVALCPLGDEADGEPTAALVEGTSLLTALIALFENYWNRAAPVHIDGNGGPLTADEARLLSLLIGGVSDKSIATQLQVSQRTVQRRVQDLMRRVDVRNRMQLSWQIGKLGWLDGAAGPVASPTASDQRTARR